MTKLHFDYETVSELDLTKVGLDRYSAHPSTRVLMASYAFDEGRVGLWEAHREPMPAELREAIEDPAVTKLCFNAQFERVISRRVLKLKAPNKSFRCAMALAYMQSFSGNLESVGSQVGLPIEKQKLTGGKKLIRMFSMPQRVTKNQPLKWRNWNTDPREWEEFGDYAIGDTESERGIWNRLVKFPIQEDEWDLYHLDQQINDRGMPIDMEFVNNGLAMAKRRKAELVEELRELTGLDNPNSPSQLTQWLREHGYRFNDINKDTVTKVLAEHKEAERDGTAEDIDDAAIEALKLRQNAGKTSYTKWEKLLQTVGADGQLRFSFQFAGAGRTSRWAGRGFQPHNLVRTPKQLEHLIHEATQAIKDNDYDLLCLLLKEPMVTITGVMRSSIRAKDGEEQRVADLSAIETRVTGWLSGCSRLIEVFAKHLDPYIDFATDLYKKPYEEVTKAERQVSKPPVLGCTYRLGGGELREGKRTGLWGYAESMGVDFSQAESAKAVKVFREGYPEIPRLWYALEEASLLAMRSSGRPIAPIVRHNGRKFKVPVTFEFRKPYLMVKLPSGRYLYYHKPRVTTEARYGKPTERHPEGEPYKKTVISYMGKKQNGHAWVRIFTHGGKWTENLVQAIARDILKVGLLRAAKFGFKIFLHVHDEIGVLVRVGDNYFTLEKLIELMSKSISWAEGLQLEAAGYAASFYRKD